MTRMSNRERSSPRKKMSPMYREGDRLIASTIGSMRHLRRPSVLSSVVIGPKPTLIRLDSAFRRRSRWYHPRLTRSRSYTHGRSRTGHSRSAKHSPTRRTTRNGPNARITVLKRHAAGRLGRNEPVNGMLAAQVRALEEQRLGATLARYHEPSRTIERFGASQGGLYLKNDSGILGVRMRSVDLHRRRF